MDREDASAVRLLTRHFLRRLLDNDLISPHADRHEPLAVLYAVVLSVAIFVTFYLSVGYLAVFIQLPGPTALSALSDRFLFIAASMAVSALAALMVWEALGLEPRDASILGPLPIPSRSITYAKLMAALVFGTAFAIALNVVPSVLYPSFLTLNLRGTTAAGLGLLIGGHALTVVMAGLFGFFGIVALRGLLRVVLGESGFRRVSGGAQSALVAAALAALALSPTVRSADVRSWIAGALPPPGPAIPVLWHLGLNETVAGDVVVGTPLAMPPGIPVSRRLRQQDDDARRAYRTLRAPFADLARSAGLALPLIAALAIATFLWTNRRLPERSDGPTRPSRARTACRSIAERLTRADPESQASFFFTLQTLTRSAPHRLIVAAAVAAAVTIPFITLVRGGVPWRVEIPSVPVGLLAIGPIVLLSLIAGFRYAVTVPAELASNWSIRQAWSGDERGYLTGAKRAATLLFVAVPLILLLPFHVALLGVPQALALSVFGYLLAVAALDGVFLGYRKVPFACSYLPIENLKVVWPCGAAGLLLVTYAFAAVARLALQSPVRAAWLCAVLGGVAVTVRWIDGAQRRERLPVDFDEKPAPPTQRLGIFDRMAIHE